MNQEHHLHHLHHLRHLDSEQLSAYLDREVEAVEARALESHLAHCAACRSRLESLRGVVHRLGRLDPPAPPPWLGAQVRHHWKLRQQAGPWYSRSWSYLGRWVMSAPRMAAAALLIPAAFSLLAYTPPPLPEPPNLPWMVDVSEGLTGVQRTTSRAAGKTFVLSERNDVWMEEGLPAGSSYERVAAGSPAGRALLTRYRDLGYLLADGSRVMLRYRRETVELWAGS
jgi:hypothetical protein